MSRSLDTCSGSRDTCEKEKDQEKYYTRWRKSRGKEKAKNIKKCKEGKNIIY